MARQSGPEAAAQQAEQAEMVAALASLKIKISRQREAEVKTRVDFGGMERVRAELKKWEGQRKVEKVFEGRTITYIFPSPQKGVSVRIRESIPDDSKLAPEYKWTIKFDSQAGVPNRPLKNKDEIEGVAASLESAREELGKITGALRMSVNVNEPQLVVEKHRTSYVIHRSGKEKRKENHEDLQVDLDTFIRAQGEELANPIFIIESEDISNLSEAVKMDRITALNESLGLSIDPEYAALSMKALLIKEGVLREEYFVMPGAIKKSTDVA